MSDKSYVTMEQNVCVVCGEIFDTGALLIDERLRERFNKETVTEWGACPEHQHLADGGYVALVGATAPSTRTTLKQEEANRTGQVAHVRKHVFEEMFNTELDPERFPMVFVDPEVIEQLQQMQEACDGQ